MGKNPNLAVNYINGVLCAKNWAIINEPLMNTMKESDLIKKVLLLILEEDIPLIGLDSIIEQAMIMTAQWIIAITFLNFMKSTIFHILW